MRSSNRREELRLALGSTAEDYHEGQGSHQLVTHIFPHSYHTFTSREKHRDNHNRRGHQGHAKFRCTADLVRLLICFRYARNQYPLRHHKLNAQSRRTGAQRCTCLYPKLLHFVGLPLFLEYQMIKWIFQHHGGIASEPDNCNPATVTHSSGAKNCKWCSWIRRCLCAQRGWRPRYCVHGSIIHSLKETYLILKFRRLKVIINHGM